MKIQGHSQTLSTLVLITSITETSFEVKSQVSLNTCFNEKKFTKPKDKQVKMSTSNFSLLTLTLSRDTGYQLMVLGSVPIHWMDRGLCFRTENVGFRLD